MYSYVHMYIYIHIHIYATTLVHVARSACDPFKTVQVGAFGPEILEIVNFAANDPDQGDAVFSAGTHPHKPGRDSVSYKTTLELTLRIVILQ